jgi:D-alanyl-D-alanine-carboxypeptidase/D-alanyl-D-alanine-endopeptidase
MKPVLAASWIALILLAPVSALGQSKPAPAPVPAKPASLPKSEVDQQVKYFIDGEYVPGMVIGVIDASGPHVYGYGKPSKTAAKAPDGDSIFEIGSVTKVFTATVFAQMLDKNEIKPNQPAESLLPGMKIPSDLGNKIWLTHLANHTSGLPANPPNLNSTHPDNPYSGYTQRQFESFLSQSILPRPPGERFEYSHVGYALLGQALAKKEKKSYEQVIIDRVCTPLGLTNTRVGINEAARPTLVQGYDVDGVEVEYWDCPPMDGAFGLKSTANDLLKFCSAHLALTPVPFAEALKSMQARQIDVNRDNDMGMAWQIGRKYSVLWQNGETGGQHAFLACLPKQKAAVVVLTNAPFRYVDTLGTNLSRILSGEPVPPFVMKIAIKLDAATLDSYVGEYSLSPQQTLTVTHENGTLYVQATGQSKLKLYAEDEKTFFGKAVLCMVEFAREQGKIVGLIFHQGGKEHPAEKIK